MPASRLTKDLIQAGLDRRPMRSLSELIAEHRELRSALAEANLTLARAHDHIHCLPRTTDSQLARLIEDTRAANHALLARVSAPTADRSAA